ncbi:MAG: hypothetical protein M3Q55_10395 [Acidobacteriota bacterium]|nr:hypothetical protein [Acidobacteriota bacterium]
MTADSHIAVVGSLAYRERLKALPTEFDATLVLEPDNRYFLNAIAVHGPSGKVGYVAPEGARSRYESIKAASASAPPTCRVRRATTDRTMQGAIELFLDLSAFPLSE